MNSKLFISRLETALIPLADAKDHMLVEHTDDDTKIQMFIDAAISHTENVIRKTLPLTEFVITVDEFGDEISVVCPPPRGIGVVTYFDGTARQVLATSEYEIDTDWNTLKIRPTTTFPEGEAIRFNLIAGYGTYAGYAGYDQVYPVALEGGTIPDVALPNELVQGIHMLIGALYESREAQSVGALNRVPYGYEALVMKHRAYKI